MVNEDFTKRANERVAELLESNNTELENFRFHGSVNRVYHIPLGDDPLEFVVVKLLPLRLSDFRRMMRTRLRDLLYGERNKSAGRRRGEYEIERYAEWEAAGMSVPGIVHTRLPGVRIIEGLPYPTLYTILSGSDHTVEEKLSILRTVTQSLAKQHATAMRLGQPGLVHRDPGPWNIMFDTAQDKTFWYDLEFPARHPTMEMEELMVRGLRVFTFGLLDHLPSHVEEVISVLRTAYEPQSRLNALSAHLEESLASLPVRITRRLGLREHRRQQQEQLAALLKES